MHREELVFHINLLRNGRHRLLTKDNKIKHEHERSEQGGLTYSIQFRIRLGFRLLTPAGLTPFFPHLRSAPFVPKSIFFFFLLHCIDFS